MQTSHLFLRVCKLQSPVSTNDRRVSEKKNVMTQDGALPSEIITPLSPLKFNMEPENGGLEDDFPFQLGDS